MNRPVTRGRIVGVILAGGRAARMQCRDKPLLELGGRSLIEHVIDSASRQCSRLVISVNRNRDAYTHLDLPMVADDPGLPAGPLAGILAAMDWYAAGGETAHYLACFPADVPFFPVDIAPMLIDACLSHTRGDGRQHPVIWCQTGSQPQPLFSVWPFATAAALRAAVAAGIPGPQPYFRTHPNYCVVLPAASGLDFFNINTPAQLAEAETHLTARQMP